ALCRRLPRPEAKAEVLAAVPRELIRHRPIRRIATHITFTPDRTAVAIDAQVGAGFFLGTLAVDGGFELWHEDTVCWNHAQLNPMDPELMLLTNGKWIHPVTGERALYETPVWLLRKGRSPEPLLSHKSWLGHETWDAAGSRVWYMDYVAGVERIDIRSRERELVWPGERGVWHSHASRDGRFLVRDLYLGKDHRRGPAGVDFFNVGTGRSVEVISEMPACSADCTGYHAHPHPRFNQEDHWLVYTTHVRGKPDLAVTPVVELLERTQRD
ncbi:hypothetical protein ACFLSJ_07400, partial [Verrucomicrobiota bacterium]